MSFQNILSSNMEEQQLFEWMQRSKFSKEMCAYQFVISLDKDTDPGIVLGCFQSSYLKKTFLQIK